MHIASMYNNLWRIPSAFPSAAYRSLLVMAIPIITQVVYRRIRYNMYSHMRVADDFAENSEKMKLRKTQHNVYWYAAVIQTVAFAFFARSNRFYLAPVFLTGAFLVWTDFSKKQEKIAGTIFKSMDEDIAIPL
jgi:hypothetical protein